MPCNADGWSNDDDLPYSMPCWLQWHTCSHRIEGLWWFVRLPSRASAISPQSIPHEPWLCVCEFQAYRCGREVRWSIYGFPISREAVTEKMRSKACTPPRLQCVNCKEVPASSAETWQVMIDLHCSCFACCLDQGVSPRRWFFLWRPRNDRHHTWSLYM